MAEETKPVHSIVLDAGPLIANTPPISTLLKKSEEIFTTPSVIAEIKDASARARLDTLVMPFITLRTPKVESMRFVTEFARKSGDLAVLSKTDLEVIALAYELECERNGGDWRLRKIPGQKTVNGAPPSRTPDTSNSAEPAADNEVTADQSGDVATTTDAISQSPAADELSGVDAPVIAQAVDGLSIKDDLESSADPGSSTASEPPSADPHTDHGLHTTSSPISSQYAEFEPQNHHDGTEEHTSTIAEVSSESEEDSDGGEWITPSNITRHKASVAASSNNQPKQPKTLQVATLTSDHALQNTLLLINLNLLSSSLTRIAHIKAHILRCHACFATTKQMEKQFCPRCGQPTLTRVTTSTNANGTTSMHLKKNMQWNTRGDRYSIPKPVAGTSNGKMREKGGGKGGWGRELILAEDQKEYVRAVKDSEREKRRAEKDYLDQDFMPGFMGTGRAHGAGGRIQIGAGRTVNSRKRK